MTLSSLESFFGFILGSNWFKKHYAYRIHMIHDKVHWVLAWLEDCLKSFPTAIPTPCSEVGSMVHSCDSWQKIHLALAMIVSSPWSMRIITLISCGWMCQLRTCKTKTIRASQVQYYFTCRIISVFFCHV